MKTYLDTITEIELVKDQIAFTKRELEYWFGIDVDEEMGIPLSGIGSHKYGANTSIVQADKKIKSLQELQLKLKELEYAKVRWDMLLEKLEGLDYKIAYKRIVEAKTHQEIAKELGYSCDYIRERWSKLKRTHTQPTDYMVKS